MAARIALRSHRSSKGETLAYLTDGFAPLVRRLEVAVAEKGGEIRTGEKVTGLIVEQGRGVGVRTAKGEVRAKAVIATVPPETLLGLHDFPVAYAEACRAIPFQGTVCLAVGAKRGVLPGIYWLNLDEPGLPFGLLIEHTNFYRHQAYPPAIFYLAAYVQSPDDPLMTMSPGEVEGLWLSAFAERFGLRRDEILWSRLTRDAATAVVYTTGSMSRIPSMETPLPGLTWAGLAHAFPERSVNRSVELGYQAADLAIGANAPSAVS
jgi:protoporphyrinogen oxidase